HWRCFIALHNSPSLSRPCARLPLQLAEDRLVTHLEQQQLTRDGAIIESVLVVTSQSQILTQLGVTGKNRPIPALTMMTQHLAQSLIQRLNRNLIRSEERRVGKESRTRWSA